MAVGRIIEIELDAPAHGGDALGRCEGKVVFVSGTIPGEVVRARVVEEKKRWARAETVRVLEPSPQRIEPLCPYFGICGGCHLQHVAYEAQLEHKRAVVIEQLRRLAHLEEVPVGPVIDMPDPWAYRNHVQFAVDEAGQLGFKAAKSHDTVPVEQCLLLHPLIDDLHGAFDVEWPELQRLSLRAGIHTGDQMCILEARGDAFPLLDVDFPVSCVLKREDGAYVPLIGSTVYQETLHGLPFQISAPSFFQVNTAQAERMIDVVRRYLEPDPLDVLLDVYCGVGALGLSMVEQVQRLIGVEAHPAAIVDAEANADIQEVDVDRAVFVRGKAEKVLPRLQEPITKVLVDPPRGGCAPRALDAIADLVPARVVYVSCEPTTLARDAVQLQARGYKLVEVQPLDMFPQTYHLETVSLWLK